jgi:hypothetical protein
MWIPENGIETEPAPAWSARPPAYCLKRNVGTKMGGMDRAGRVAARVGVHDVFTLASVIFERLPDGLVKVVEE